jgi:SpoVK/Ycf46/Vps4 family AAA+-type ATPase
MSLVQRLVEYISACFSALWIQSFEHEDALREIAQMCREQNWRLATWDVEQGLQIPGQANGQPTDAGGSDPLAAIRSINALASADSSAILVLANFHRYLSSPEIVQALARQITLGKQNRTFVVVLSPVISIPIELEKLFAVVEHDLPNRQQIEEIARGVATEDGELPDGPELDRVLEAAAGLTRYEVENAFSLSLVRHRRIEPESIWELKSQMLKKSGLLTLHRGGERFADLGGLEPLKAFCLRAMRNQGHRDSLRRPKGVLLLSPPGCGKSQFCKALGNETGRPTLVLDVGGLLGSLVGQSEANIRQALRIADAMAPCVLFVDELEKALSGVASSGQTDSGVSARLFGTLLTWMSDHGSDVFVVATSNDIGKLPPELSRAERFDGVWFLDLPSVQQRRTIWTLCGLPHNSHSVAHSVM